MSNQDNIRFCTKCGQSLKEVPGKSETFCTGCGAKVTWKNESIKDPSIVDKNLRSYAKSLNKKLDAKKIKIAVVLATAILVLIGLSVFMCSLISSCQAKDALKRLGFPETVSVGDTFSMGSYEQDGNTLNGSEPISWRVLAVEGKKALIISEYGLDAHRFNQNRSDGNDWNTSGLKLWLQSDFALKAGLFDVKDKLTCLSLEEANKYFKNDSERLCVPTAYAVKNNVYQKDAAKVDNKGTCSWWLSSPGDSSDSASFVLYVGTDSYSDRVDSDNNAVRPAMWIDM